MPDEAEREPLVGHGWIDRGLPRGDVQRVKPLDNQPRSPERMTDPMTSGSSNVEEHRIW
jgi:hypothetical protein